MYQCSPKTFFSLVNDDTKNIFTKVVASLLSLSSEACTVFFFMCLTARFSWASNSDSRPDCGLPTAFSNAKFPKIWAEFWRQLSNSGKLYKTSSERAAWALSRISYRHLQSQNENKWSVPVYLYSLPSSQRKLWSMFLYIFRDILRVQSWIRIQCECCHLTNRRILSQTVLEVLLRSPSRTVFPI